MNKERLYSQVGGHYSGKDLPANARDVRNIGLIPGSGRPPAVWNGYPVQYSCLENPMDRGAWWVTVHGATVVGHD